MKEIGFMVNLLTPNKTELRDNNLEFDENINRYLLTFEAKNFTEAPNKLKKELKIQISLLIITSALIIFSAYFYILFIEPYYGSLYAVDPVRTFWYIFFFCFGMFSTITVHEFGHILFARKHKVNTSLPFLIPGPPPMGMLGAFVRIKDDPQTRNHKFDIAIGGILCGISISIMLLIIGLYLSEYMDTSEYINLRASYSGISQRAVAEDISENLNMYNLFYIIIRLLMFENPIYSSYFGYSLPQNILILHPLAYAGWIGLILSGLNLIPIPMLDGGHALKTVFPGKYTRLVVNRGRNIFYSNRTNHNISYSGMFWGNEGLRSR